jgi:hypothetical protein
VLEVVHGLGRRLVLLGGVDQPDAALDVGKAHHPQGASPGVVAAAHVHGSHGERRTHWYHHLDHFADCRRQRGASNDRAYFPPAPLTFPAPAHITDATGIVSFEVPFEQAGLTTTVSGFTAAAHEQVADFTATLAGPAAGSLGSSSVMGTASRARSAGRSPSPAMSLTTARSAATCSRSFAGRSNPSRCSRPVSTSATSSGTLCSLAPGSAMCWRPSGCCRRICARAACSSEPSSSSPPTYTSVGHPTVVRPRPRPSGRGAANPGAWVARWALHRVGRRSGAVSSGDARPRGFAPLTFCSGSRRLVLARMRPVRPTLQLSAWADPRRHSSVRVRAQGFLRVTCGSPPSHAVGRPRSARLPFPNGARK